jgi:beta-hydroxylase
MKQVGKMLKILIIVLGIVVVVWGLCLAWDHGRGRDRLPFWSTYTGEMLWLTPYNVLVVDCFGMPDSNTPFLSKSKFFTHHKDIEAQWKVIREEALTLYKGRRTSPIKTDKYFKTIADYDWHKFYIKWYGEVDERAHAECPRTVALLEQFPEIHLAMFSILKPGSVIKRHRGPFRGAMRYHLGLVCPDKGCELTLDGEKYRWKEGEGVLFDDTYAHSVRNNSDEVRIVLFLDIERPLSAPGRWINHWFCTDVAGRLTGRKNPPRK